MVTDFCPTGGWWYIGWWLRDLRTLVQFQWSEMSAHLFQDPIDAYITFWDSSSLNCGSHQRYSHSAVSQSVIITVCSQSRDPKFEYLFAFQFWYYEFCVKSQWGGKRGWNHYFVNFCFVGLLQLLMGEGRWGGAESLI